VREFVRGHRLGLSLVVVAVLVAFFVVLFLAGHGGVSGGAG
jgi:hypothetical protein